MFVNQQIIDAIQAFHDKYNSQIAELVSSFNKPFQTLMGIDWKAVQRFYEELPARSRIAMELVSAKGWFFGWTGDAQDLSETIDSICSAKPDELDELMAKHFRDNFDYLLARLIEESPDRESIISDAADAHKEGRFNLSVPVFLSQADGIFSQITQTKGSALQKESKGSGKLRGQVAIEQYVKNQDTRDMLHPIYLLHELELLLGERQRYKQTWNPLALNRHQVLHGEVTDYGSELNSLRAFSFLSFCGVHIPETIRYDS